MIIDWPLIPMYEFFNNQRRILKKWKANWSSTLRLAWSLWHWLSLFILNLLGYLTKNTQLSPFPWKQSEWQNTEQLGTNQNARSVDKLRARCGSQEANDELKKKLKSIDGPVRNVIEYVDFEWGTISLSVSFWGSLTIFSAHYSLF